MLWRDFQRPKRLECNRETLTGTYGQFYAQPFERGFGTSCKTSIAMTRGAHSISF